MRIIPVIDIMRGKAVHAVRGEREKYKLVCSWLSTDADPISLVSNFLELGFKGIYVADIDAITTRKMNYGLYRVLARKAYLYLDAGIRYCHDIEAVVNIGVDRVIIPTETFAEIDNLRRVLDIYGSRLIVSIDHRGGQILSPVSRIRSMTPFQMLRTLSEIGFDDAIIIDLDRVGSFKGIDIGMIQKLLDIDMKLYIGGGIRDINDIVLLDQMGVYGVLMASALHNRSINIDELRQRGYI